MKLELQVCTLEQAKKLKELGVKQESYFRHYLDSIGGHHTTPNRIKWYDEDFTFAAFTVAELGVMLPNDIEIHRTARNLIYCNHIVQMDRGETLASWFAKSLIHFIEYKMVTVEEINERL